MELVPLIFTAFLAAVFSAVPILLAISAVINFLEARRIRRALERAAWERYRARRESGKWENDNDCGK